MNRRPHSISAELVDEISGRLAANRQVRYRLHRDGCVHIDRQLPFLCVYRQPADREDNGTASLMLGQAAYLKTSSDPDLQADISALIYSIVKTQSAAFGGFLLIELWAGEEREDAGRHPVRPAFHLHAPRQGAPGKTLDALEGALLGIRLRKQRAEVRISYQDDCFAPGLAPLLTHQEAARLECVTLGLEIRPVYRDPVTGEVLPFALNIMRRKVTLALKKAFYSFSHHSTRYRPRHYHELGRRAMTRAVWDTDQRLAEISERFDLLLHVTPVNVGEAWSAFEQSGYSRMPEFHYRPRSADPALLKRALYQTPLEKIEDPTLAAFFTAKRDELDRQITLLNDRNTPRFLHGSIQLFGDIDAALLDAAKKLMARPPGRGPCGKDEILDAGRFAQRAREEMAYYRERDPSLAARVEVRADVSGLMVSHGNFLIGADAGVSRARLDAAISHEIGTHVLTYHNGRKQRLKQLYAGMAGYEELQEGLAVLAEYLVGGLDIPRMQILAGRVIAVHGIMSGADFIETFRLLHHDYGFKPYTAFTIAMRVCRGGGYTKDMIYLRGLMNLLDHLGEHDEPDILFSGKIALEQLPLLRELQWRKVVQPAALMPRYLSDNNVRQRLSKLKSEPSLEHMMGNL